MAEDEHGQDIRVSNADRDRAMTQLQDALARGMIDTDEFADRSERALRARTSGDIRPLIADLAMEPAATQDVVEFRGTSSSLKRKGAWRVPRRLALIRRGGSVELDFTQAVIEYPTIDIELDIKGGSVEMRLPAGASATIDDIDVTRGSVEDHRKNPALSGRPHFLITGTLRGGSVELRGPRRGLGRR